MWKTIECIGAHGPCEHDGYVVVFEDGMHMYFERDKKVGTAFPPRPLELPYRCAECEREVKIDANLSHLADRPKRKQTMADLMKLREKWKKKLGDKWMGPDKLERK